LTWKNISHLGSVSVVLSANGAILEQQRYLTFTVVEWLLVFWLGVVS